MKSLTFKPVLFGLDLRQLVQDWSHALQLMARWPGVRWLSPRFPVRLRFPDGSEETVIDTGNGFEQLEETVSTPYRGVVIDQERVLWHSMPVAGLSDQDLASAVELEVQRLSPFPAEELVSASFMEAGEHAHPKRVHIAITSHKLLEEYSPPPDEAAQGSGSPATKGEPQPELWVQLPQSDDLRVWPGFGEKRRHKKTLFWRLINLTLVGLIVLTLTWAAMTPSLQLRKRVQQAHDDYTQLQTRAVPAQKAREHWVEQQAKVQQLQKLVGGRLVPEYILLLLTQYLPDDAYVIVLEAKGDRINLVGAAPNANQLVLHLEKQPGIKRVVTVTPARKEGNREVFTIEFVLDTAQAQNSALQPVAEPAGNSGPAQVKKS